MIRTYKHLEVLIGISVLLLMIYFVSPIIVISQSTSGSFVGRPVAFSPDLSKVAIVDQVDTCLPGVMVDVIIVELETNTTLRNLGSVHCNISDIAWSPDGSMVALTGNEIHVWELQTGTIIYQDFVNLTPLVSLVWSPDSRYLAAGKTISIEIHDVNGSSDPINLFSPGSPFVSSVAWHPDGLRIGAGYDNGYIMIWDVSSQSMVQQFTSGVNSVDTIAWSPDGTRLAVSGYQDQDTISVLDILNGDVTFNLIQSEGSIGSLQWSPDGQYLVSSERVFTVVNQSNARVLLWDMTSGNQVSEVSNGVFVGSLTWSQYGGRLKYFINPRNDDPFIEDGTSLPNGGMTTVTAPAASPQRIQTIEASCGVDILLTTNPATDINGYRAAVEALTSQQIDDACRADLLALVDAVVEDDPTCCGQQANQSPTADAGADQTVNDATDTALVTLDGSASSDPDGTPAMCGRKTGQRSQLVSRRR